MRAIVVSSLMVLLFWTGGDLVPGTEGGCLRAVWGSSDSSAQEGMGTTIPTAPRSAENGHVLLADSFDAGASEWRGICLEGREGAGDHSTAGGRLTIEAREADTTYGVWRPTSVSGHFYVEVEFEEDGACGLGLIQEKNGRPDPRNFTSIGVERNDEGKVVVYVRDRQNGTEDVLDNTGALEPERYRHVLNNEYSVPFDGANGKFRILRDSGAGFVHFYYGVRKKIRGKWVEGWMELAPSREWGEPDQSYYVVLYARSGEKPVVTAQFDSVRVVRKPKQDRDDRQTGFRVVRREYNWSGFFGDAVVVTFGSEFPYRQQDCKFVFWSEASYVPVWHMNNQLLQCYEFVETWGGGSRGCFEPMSDRLLRWAGAEIVEDNEVRKTVRFHYVLCDPDYRVPDDGEGSQAPEVDEFWTFYPDGTGTRHVLYYPKLDTDYRSWHELAELDPVAGSLTDPRDHLASPALTVFNLEGEVLHYHPEKHANAEVNGWRNVIAAVNYRGDLPSAFLAVCNEAPATYGGYPAVFDVSWHDVGYRFAHWPVGKEPYQQPAKTHGTWKAQVSHTSLFHVGAVHGVDWSDRCKVDERGRAYREWVMLVGLNERGDLDGMRAKVAAWIRPGTVTMLGPDSRYDGVNYQRKELVFVNTSDAPKCQFVLDPGEGGSVVNPMFRIRGWGEHGVEVDLNGERLDPGADFRATTVDGDALVWIRTRLDSPGTFTIRGS